MRLTNGMRRAAVMAAKALAARGGETLPVSPLAMLHACRDTCVYTMEAAVEAEGIPRAQLESLFRLSDAVTFCIGEGEARRYIVVFRADGNPARLRFTLAHELGHRILHDGEPTAASEREADCFASHLLCPEAVVRRIRKGAADLATAVDRIAGICYVSRACARTALTRDRILLPEALGRAMENFAEKALERRLPKGE